MTGFMSKPVLDSLQLKMTLNFWSSGVYLLSTGTRRYAATTNVQGIRDQIQSSGHAGQDLPATPRKYLIVYFITVIDRSTVVTSCPNRHRESRALSMAFWATDTLSSTADYHLQREGKCVYSRKKKYCIKGKNQSGQTERHLLPVFTSWLVFTILGHGDFFFFFVSRCLYISSHLHLYPDLSPFLKFHFSCDLSTIAWSFFPLSPLPARPSPALLITTYLEAPWCLVMESCIVFLTCEKINQLCLSHLTEIQSSRVWKALFLTDQGLGDLQGHHS